MQNSHPVDRLTLELCNNKQNKSNCLYSCNQSKNCHNQFMLFVCNLLQLGAPCTFQSPPGHSSFSYIHILHLWIYILLGTLSNLMFHFFQLLISLSIVATQRQCSLSLPISKSIALHRVI